MTKYEVSVATDEPDTWKALGVIEEDRDGRPIRSGDRAMTEWAETHEEFEGGDMRAVPMSRISKRTVNVRTARVVE